MQFLWLLTLLCFLVLPANGQVPNQKSNLKDTGLSGELEPVVRDIQDIELRLNALEVKLQPQVAGSSAAPQPGTESVFELNLSRGGARKGNFEKYGPLIIPSVVSVIVVGLSFLTQVRLQRSAQLAQKQLQADSQKHQSDLQRLSQDNQQRLQEISQDNQQRLQGMAYENTQKLQEEARRGTRQLEAAQELWDLVEQTVSFYLLNKTSTPLGNPISGIAPMDRSQSLKDIGILFRKHGFFLPQGTAPILTEIRDQLLEQTGSLATLNDRLLLIKKTMRQEMNLKF